MIPYSRHTINEEDIKAVSDVLRSDWLTQGKTVEAFEKKLSSYCGAKFAVSFSSGTAALQAAYFSAGIKHGDEIITSAMTFAATANAAIWQGAKVIFCDIDSWGNLDPKEVEKKITKKTKAIVLVDYAGLPGELDELKYISSKYKLILIEDASHALGAQYKGKKIGGISDMTTFSFHPLKSITTGEGGAVTTSSLEYFERLKLFRSHGITKDPMKYKKNNVGAWYHEMQALGLNYRLTDFQCALGLSQIKKLPKFIKKRSELALRYNKMLKNVPGLMTLESAKEKKSAHHLYPILIKDISKRKEIFDGLKKAGIGVQVHYIPVYLHPYYENLGYEKGLCPRAEDLYQSEISIPLYPALSFKDQQYVVKTIKTLLTGYNNYDSSNKRKTTRIY